MVTSYHVRRARGGDEESLAWIVNRFAPLLRVTSEYRLGKALRSLYDPEDIVNEVWAVVLPKLRELKARDERYTPVLLKFLSTTLLNKVNNLVQKHIRGKPTREARRTDLDPLEKLEADTTGVIHRLLRMEARDLVAEALEKLEPKDREILILRGIEQHPYKEIAALIGADSKSLAVRYQRALEKLRRQLPGSIYEEFRDQ